MVAHSWIILLAPLAASALILAFAIHRRKLAAGLAVGGLLVSFVITASLFVQALNGQLRLPAETAVAWISVPGVEIAGDARAAGGL